MPNPEALPSSRQIIEDTRTPREKEIDEMAHAILNFDKKHKPEPGDDVNVNKPPVPPRDLSQFKIDD